MMLVSFLALNIILIFFRGKVGEGILKKMFHHDETFLFPSCDVLVDLKKKKVVKYDILILNFLN